MAVYIPTRYAKVKEDGSIDIIDRELRTDKCLFYYPSERTAALFGYYPIIEADPKDFVNNDPKIKLMDRGLQVVEDGNKKVVMHVVDRLPIVDEPPDPGDGMYVRGDEWKEIDGKWVHVYDYASSTRHKRRERREQRKEEEPNVEIKEETPVTEEPTETAVVPEATEEVPSETTSVE